MILKKKAWLPSSANSVLIMTRNLLLQDLMTEIKKEATVAIETVIARYGYTPEFSYFRTQVGAVIASINKEYNKAQNLSSEISKEISKDFENNSNLAPIPPKSGPP
jgi:hypothetical protein